MYQLAHTILHVKSVQLIVTVNEIEGIVLDFRPLFHIHMLAQVMTFLIDIECLPTHQ